MQSKANNVTRKLNGGKSNSRKIETILVCVCVCVCAPAVEIDLSANGRIGGKKIVALIRYHTCIAQLNRWCKNETEIERQMQREREKPGEWHRVLNARKTEQVRWFEQKNGNSDKESRNVVIICSPWTRDIPIIQSYIFKCSSTDFLS